MNIYEVNTSKSHKIFTYFRDSVLPSLPQLLHEMIKIERQAHQNCLRAELVVIIEFSCTKVLCTALTGVLGRVDLAEVRLT